MSGLSDNNKPNANSDERPSIQFTPEFKVGPHLTDLDIEIAATEKQIKTIFEVMLNQKSMTYAQSAIADAKRLNAIREQGYTTVVERWLEDAKSEVEKWLMEKKMVILKVEQAGRQD